MTTAAPPRPLPVPCEACGKATAGLTFDPITQRKLCLKCWRVTGAVRDKDKPPK